MQTLIDFEAAARLQSFTLAAAELNLTQPAVSPQVKLLEDRLGLKLFDRRNILVLLSEQGRQFTEDVEEILNSLGETVQNLAPEAGRTTLDSQFAARPPLFRPGLPLGRIGLWPTP